MSSNDPNVSLIEIVAERLGDDLRESVVFVGGAVAGLLITDPAMPAIRPTEDVDLICQAVLLSDYHRLEEALRAHGFVQDMRPLAPICRWQTGSVAVDVMPPLEEILGFANRWYPTALETAQPVVLPSGRPIKLIAAPAALKHDRAESDALAGSPRFRRWGGQIAVCWRQVRAGCVGGVGSVKRASSGGRSSGTIAGRAFPGAEKAVRGGFWGRLRQVTRVAVERVGRGARASAQDRARGQRRNFG